MTPGYDATLYPKDQIKYEEVLSCIKKVYLNISCQKPSFINFLGQRVRKAVKDGKYREICCIEINLERTFPSLPPPVVVTMGDYTLQGGEASIEDNEPWLEGEPEYEWSMAVPEKVEALLAAQPQPVRYSGDLMMVILNSLRAAIFLRTWRPYPRRRVLRRFYQGLLQAECISGLRLRSIRRWWMASRY